jgi:type IV secretion system protein VirD4
MDDSKFVLTLRNFFVVALAHICAIVGLFWISGVAIAFFTNELHLIGLNDNALEITYKWLKWLISAWSQLPYDGYNYLKIKLVLSVLVPFLIVAIIYHKNFDKIKEWRPYKSKEKVYGDASWATQSDIERAGLRSKQGMLLGKDNKGYYVADGFQHALLFAPTGSGKGVGFVIPNLLFWDHSVVVHDIKLENHELTSGWRAQQGQQVFVWEPANPDGKTHCYNPIDWVSNKPGQMVDDVQKISNLIMPEKDFWNNEARSLFVGVVLYLIADPSKPKSFGEVVRTMRSDDVVYNLAVVLDTLGKVIHPVAYMNLAAFLQKADKERSGVISTLNSSLELWANPLIDAATATSDFNIQEFKKKKTTVYVGLTPDNIQRLQKLMQVFYQQATEFLSRKMPDLKEEPYGVMFLLDEFPTLGKMEQFKAGIAYFRGYRVRLFLIIQDTQQLKGTYEEAGMNSFLSNSTYRITFAANNYETANLISQLCGNKTVQQTSQSKPKFFDLNPATRTVNVSEVQRALLLPQEVIQLPRDEQIVLIESMPPIRSNKIKYFDDKFFTKRLLPPTFIPTQVPFDPRQAESEEFEEDLEDEENLDEAEDNDELHGAEYIDTEEENTEETNYVNDEEIPGEGPYSDEEQEEFIVEETKNDSLEESKSQHPLEQETQEDIVEHDFVEEVSNEDQQLENNIAENTGHSLEELQTEYTDSTSTDLDENINKESSEDIVAGLDNQLFEETTQDIAEGSNANTQDEQVDREYISEETLVDEALQTDNKQAEEVISEEDHVYVEDESRATEEDIDPNHINEKPTHIKEEEAQSVETESTEEQGEEAANEYIEETNDDITSEEYQEETDEAYREFIEEELEDEAEETNSDSTSSENFSKGKRQSSEPIKPEEESSEGSNTNTSNPSSK